MKDNMLIEAKSAILRGDNELALVCIELAMTDNPDDYTLVYEEPPPEPRYEDNLMQGYERIGMTSAFHKYGKHSTFGYKHQDKRDE